MDVNFSLTILRLGFASLKMAQEALDLFPLTLSCLVLGIVLCKILFHLLKITKILENTVQTSTFGNEYLGK